MLTESFEVDVRVANKMEEKYREERWPVHIQLGIPFRSENDNHMVDITVEYEDDFQFGEKLEETINRVFNLKDKEL